jgi:hypothetical protein
MLVCRCSMSQIVPNAKQATFKCEKQLTSFNSK